MMFVADAIIYGFPSGAWLMLGAPFLLWLFWSLFQDREKTIRAFIGERMEKHLAVRRTFANQALRATLLALAWLAGTMALMQPSWQKIRSPKEAAEEALAASTSPTKGMEWQRRPHDVILLLDVSSSMNAVDTNTGQTRLERAKDLMADTVTRLAADTIGVDAFTVVVKDVVPPTLDHLYLRMLLRTVQSNETGVMGTDFRHIFNDLYQRLWARPSDKLVTLVLFSDGGDTHLEALPSNQRSAYTKQILDELGDVDTAHRRIFTVGMGSLEGHAIPGLDEGGKPVLSALQADFMRQIAQKGNGAYFQANNYEGVGLSEELASQILQKEPHAHPTFSGQSTLSGASIEAPFLPEPLFYWPVLLAVGLLAGALALPEVESESAQAKPSRMVS